MQRWSGSCQILAVGAMALLTVMPLGAAQAELSKDEQKCINLLNSAGRGVTKAAGLVWAGCIKDYSKGKNVSAEACRDADAKDKIQKAFEKTDKQFLKKCFEKIGGPAPIGPQDAAQVNDAAIRKEDTLLLRVLGRDIDDVVAVEDGSTEVKNAAKCQQKVLGDLLKCEDTKILEFLKCKKDALKGKNGPAIMTAQELQDLCLGVGAVAQPDDKGKIAKKCTNPEKSSIFKDLDKKCEGKGVDLVEVFGGGSCADAAALGGVPLAQCLEALTECEVCKWANRTDGLDRDCDLFDNGVADDSCDGGVCAAAGSTSTICTFDQSGDCFGGANDGLTCDPAAAAATCPDGVCPARSRLVIQAAGFPITINMKGGSVDVECDSDGGLTEECTCSFVDVDPPFALIGFACLTPFAGCDTGTLSCGLGGDQLDVATRAFKDVGDCSVSVNGADVGNPSCVELCGTHCGTLGGNQKVATATCDGYCVGGPNDNQICILDGDCPGGQCAGQDVIGASPPPLDPICSCTCESIGGEDASAGGLQCNIGTNIVVESFLPCGPQCGAGSDNPGDPCTMDAECPNGACGDALLNLGSMCIPSTTERASGVILDANGTPGAIVPPGGIGVLDGRSIPADVLLAGSASGMRLVSQIAVFGAIGVGDLSISVEIGCE